ncbi:unnamed protein product [Amoebophrya sp. A120]|nr:unnamed protein product [Amoebophrya sp. A120]|eukprot:GSA120T00004660001.1
MFFNRHFFHRQRRTFNTKSQHFFHQTLKNAALPLASAKASVWGWNQLHRRDEQNKQADTGNSGTSTIAAAKPRGGDLRTGAGAGNSRVERAQQDFGVEVDNYTTATCKNSTQKASPRPGQLHIPSNPPSWQFGVILRGPRGLQKTTVAHCEEGGRGTVRGSTRGSPRGAGAPGLDDFRSTVTNFVPGYNGVPVAGATAFSAAPRQRPTSQQLSDGAAQLSDEKNAQQPYDVAIIGAGIAGTALTYFLVEEIEKQRKSKNYNYRSNKPFRILLLDKETAGAGATGLSMGTLFPLFQEDVEIEKNDLKQLKDSELDQFVTHGTTEMLKKLQDELRVDNARSTLSTFRPGPAGRRGERQHAGTDDDDEDDPHDEDLFFHQNGAYMVAPRGNSKVEAYLQRLFKLWKNERSYDVEFLESEEEVTRKMFPDFVSEDDPKAENQNHLPRRVNVYAYGDRTDKRGIKDGTTPCMAIYAPRGGLVDPGAVNQLFLDMALEKAMESTFNRNSLVVTVQENAEVVQVVLPAAGTGTTVTGTEKALARGGDGGGGGGRGRGLSSFFSAAGTTAAPTIPNKSADFHLSEVEEIDARQYTLEDQCLFLDENPLSNCIEIHVRRPVQVQAQGYHARRNGRESETSTSSSSRAEELELEEELYQRQFDKETLTTAGSASGRGEEMKVVQQDHNMNIVETVHAKSIVFANGIDIPKLFDEGQILRREDEGMGNRNSNSDYSRNFSTNKGLSCIDLPIPIVPVLGTVVQSEIRNTNLKQNKPFCFFSAESFQYWDEEVDDYGLQIQSAGKVERVKNGIKTTTEKVKNGTKDFLMKTSNSYNTTERAAAVIPMKSTYDLDAKERAFHIYGIIGKNDPTELLLGFSREAFCSYRKREEFRQSLDSYLHFMSYCSPFMWHGLAAMVNVLENMTGSKSTVFSGIFSGNSNSSGPENAVKDETSRKFFDTILKQHLDTVRDLRESWSEETIRAEKQQKYLEYTKFMFFTGIKAPESILTRKINKEMEEIVNSGVSVEKEVTTEQTSSKIGNGPHIRPELQPGWEGWQPFSVYGKPLVGPLDCWSGGTAANKDTSSTTQDRESIKTSSAETEISHKEGEEMSDTTERKSSLPANVYIAGGFGPAGIKLAPFLMKILAERVVHDARIREESEALNGNTGKSYGGDVLQQLDSRNRRLLRYYDPNPAVERFRRDLERARAR